MMGVAGWMVFRDAKVCRTRMAISAVSPHSRAKQTVNSSIMHTKVHAPEVLAQQSAF